MSVFLALITLGFLWGSSFVLARYAMTHGLSPVLYTFFQIVGPIILLSIINFRDGKLGFIGSKCNIFLRKYSKFFLVTAIIGILLPDVNKFYLAQHLPSGSLGVITNTVPLFIYILAIIMREERFSWLRFFGVMIGVTGIFLLVMKGGGLNIKVNVWALLALLSPLCYAVASVYIVRHNPRNCSSSELCFGMLFYAALLLLPLALVTLPHQLSTVLTWNLSFIIILGIVLTTLGYLLLFVVLRKAGSVCYGLTDGIVAITSLFWGALFFAERLTWVAAVGVLLILLGIVIVVKHQLQIIMRKNKGNLHV